MTGRVSDAQLSASRMLAAWKRREAEKAAGHPLADEHWFAYLLSIARRVPRPACDLCDDAGIVQLECTAGNRCSSIRCEAPERWANPTHTHSYARPCVCEAGVPYQRSFAKAQERTFTPAASSKPKASYGFRKAGA